MRHFLCWPTLLLLAAVWGPPVMSRAAAEGAETPAGIAVHGTGDVLAKPNVVEIQMRSAAKAELTGDAIVKYRDSKKRTLAAFTGLSLENIEIEEQGFSIGPGASSEAMQAMMRGMAAPAGSKTQIELASTLIVRVKGIEDLTPEQLTETVGKILDAAQDAGVSLGPSQEEANMAWRYGRPIQGGGGVKFILTEVAQVRERAYEKAVEDARTRATRLARLNGVELGGVLSVQEVQVSGEETQQVQQPWGYYAGPTETPRGVRITSTSLGEIPFRVKLQVRFSIKPGETKGPAG